MQLNPPIREYKAKRRNIFDSLMGVILPFLIIFHLLNGAISVLVLIFPEIAPYVSWYFYLLVKCRDGISTFCGWIYYPIGLVMDCLREGFGIHFWDCLRFVVVSASSIAGLGFLIFLSIREPIRKYRGRRST